MSLAATVARRPALSEAEVPTRRGDSREKTDGDEKLWPVKRGCEETEELVALVAVGPATSPASSIFAPLARPAKNAARPPFSSSPLPAHPQAGPNCRSTHRSATARLRGPGGGSTLCADCAADLQRRSKPCPTCACRSPRVNAPQPIVETNYATRRRHRRPRRLRRPRRATAAVPAHRATEIFSGDLSFATPRVSWPRRDGASTARRGKAWRSPSRRCARRRTSRSRSSRCC